MRLRFLKVSTTTNEKYSVIIRNYTIEIYQNLTDSLIDLTVTRNKSTGSGVIVRKKIDTGIIELNSIEKCKMSFSVDDPEYKVLFLRMIKDFPNSNNDDEYNEQKFVFDRAVNLMANLLVSKTFCLFDDSDSKQLFINDNIKDYTSDIKRIIKDFIFKYLQKRLENSFFKSIEPLNNSKDMIYYKQQVEINNYKVLTKDGNVKHSSADNLFIVRTNACFDVAQTRINSLIRDTSINAMISRQHKKSLSKDNIPEI